MAHRTAKITYDLKDRGYKLNGTDRNNINVPALVSMINSAAIQELVKNGALIGYYGHQFRLLFDMNVPESAVVGGKVVRLEPAVRTVYLSTNSHHRLALFLRCLHGSEQNRCAMVAVYTFLSCLHGSEPAVNAAWTALAFLSCLHGSEQAP